jgi:hypothetical protein
MNFEAKDLIKWGIPGWIFITGVMGFIVGIDYSVLKNLKDYNILSVVLASVGLGVPIGYVFHQTYFFFNWIIDVRKEERFRKHYEPILTIIEEKNIKLVHKKPVQETESTDKTYEEKPLKGQDAYFKIEALWHHMLSDFTNDIEEKQRQYIAQRYEYYLRKIHSLGVLTYSFINLLVFYVIIIVCIKIFNIEIFNIRRIGPADCFGIVVLGISIILLAFASYKTYRYYSSNLVFFQAEMMKKHLKP